LKQTLSWISYWVLFFLVLKHHSKCKRSRDTKKSATRPSIHPSAKPIVPLHISKQSHTQCVSKDRPKTQKQKKLSPSSSTRYQKLGLHKPPHTQAERGEKKKKTSTHPSTQEEENTKVKVKYVPCLQPQIETWQNPKTRK
jgi:hypothetical protein